MRRKIGFSRDKAVQWASRLRYTKIWPLVRPFYLLFNKVFNFEALLGSTRSKILKAHRYRLNSLGFEDKTLSELESLIQDNILKSPAAWELALWHADQYSREHAMKCLNYLSIAASSINHRDKDSTLRAAIIESECHNILGNNDIARQNVHKALSIRADADLFLAAANLEQDLSAKIYWINKAFDINQLSTIDVKTSSDNLFFDCLMPTESNAEQKFAQKCKISVIMPAYNAQYTIATALESILSQTWQNLEVIVIDDCSQDETISQAKEFESLDKRVRIISTPENQGPYIARNIALKQATGEFVTCHDADDWSHPQKLEIQAAHLLNSPETIANTSQLSRAFNDLLFFRRGNPGRYIQVNMSSLMFRRVPVLEKAGFWDSVRFGADGEFTARLKKIFGEASVQHLKTGPLSFLRQSPDSLTGSRHFGYPGFFMGARKEYKESFEYFHEHTSQLFINHTIQTRSFPVPAPMLPRRTSLKNRKHFDVIIASDFRLPGGTTVSNIEEIKAQTSFGMSTGLVQMNRYDLVPSRKIDFRVRQILNGDTVSFITFGEKVSCDVLIIRHPPVLQDQQNYIPDIQAENVRVIVNQTPVKHYGTNPKFYYSFKSCLENLNRYCSCSGVWHPIGPLIRKALHEHHAHELELINLDSNDWHNIIDVSRWRRPSRPAQSNKILIGRHSRDDIYKWPDNPGELLTIYPESDRYEVHVLGGAQAPQKMLGRLPSNWHVLEFGAVHPQTFLSKLDFFVYYTHPDLVESFGRVIFEAMATGVPVIIPPDYKVLFQEAALYARPSEVESVIDYYTDDSLQYDKQVEKALHFVEDRFGYSRHKARLKGRF
ncbi:glycosyltransferase [Desulfonatronovibrio magnus]|uniref:glycosyltransferase n=1 Tax=Desulfonatronovibrio magnus TaxID=698827 RepID=UPI0018DE2730|nr:glycosyltransferase [Desulfonatronovibrio magnus]